MKLLERLRKEAAPTRTLICTGEGEMRKGCGAKLLVEKTDVKHEESSMKGRYRYFTCCDCGVHTDITPDEFPQ